MKTCLKFILPIAATALMVFSASAQNWTVNGATQQRPLTPSASESAVAVDPANGIVSVKTDGIGPSISISANPICTTEAKKL